MKLLVCGGAGFIGSHFIKLVLKSQPDWVIVNYDLLTYAGNLENLTDIQKNPKYSFIKGDICDKSAVQNAAQGCDVVVNFAAESHVDRSITGPGAFIRTNIVGTQILLDVTRELKIPKFLQVSTDEVYGSLGPSGKFTENSPLEPNSPYAASKASADLLCRAYNHTFGMNILITRCSNNYGPNQFPEKFIPLMINNALNNRDIPVYGDGLNIRDWIYVVDHCEGILKVLTHGKSGEVYNISSNEEWTNLDLAKNVLKTLEKPESLLKFVKDRPGHDRRYALDSTKISTDLGWKPKTDFPNGIKQTIQWYQSNLPWLTNITSGSYQKYYAQQYS